MQNIGDQRLNSWSSVNDLHMRWTQVANDNGMNFFGIISCLGMSYT
jgi:hypothetical protein